MRKTPNIYFKVSDTVGIAFNRKVGSSSIARALCAKLPEADQPRISFPDDGKGENRVGWQSVVPKIENPTTVLLLVRDPIEKFRSACAQINRADVDVILAAMESGDWVNPHFLPQKPLAINTTKLYRFPDDLESFADEAGLPFPLPQINEGEGEKPVLTTGQTDRLAAIYAEDLALFASINDAGQVLGMISAAPPTQADCIAIGKQQVQNAGYGADEKVICLNKLLKVKDQNALASYPKLVACYTWLETVQAMAVAGQVNFPPAPHTFEEVVAE